MCQQKLGCQIQKDVDNFEPFSSALGIGRGQGQVDFPFIYLVTHPFIHSLTHASIHALIEPALPEPLTAGPCLRCGILTLVHEADVTHENASVTGAGTKLCLGTSRAAEREGERTGACANAGRELTCKPVLHNCGDGLSCPLPARSEERLQRRPRPSLTCRNSNAKALSGRCRTTYTFLNLLPLPLHDSASKFLCTP